MKNLLIIISILFLGACTEEKTKNEVAIFNNIRVVLEKGEQVNESDLEAIKIYDQYCNNNQEIQIPLFKYIKHEEYDIFVGLPLRTTVERFVQEKNTGDSTLTNMSIVHDKTYCIQSYNKDDLSVVEYIQQVEGRSIVYMAALSHKVKDPTELLGFVKASTRIKNN